MPREEPGALPVARDFEARGLPAQSTAVKADLLSTDFGVNLYDICPLGQIADSLMPTRNAVFAAARLPRWRWTRP
jgi:hypothetical protein